MNDGVPGRISYCVTCKNRLWQLRETLPENLERVRADGRAEIVLVNYNSDDGLDTWVRRFRPEIESGLLRYLHERSEPYIHLSKAKNLAHFGSTGEFLVNLDADNFIGDTVRAWREVWAREYDTLVHGFVAETDRGRFGRRDGLPADGNGTCGRIGLPRRHFLALGGYDEEMLPMSQQDVDLIDRARALGLGVVRVPQPDRASAPAAICNSIQDKLAHTGSSLSWEEMRRRNRERRLESLRLGRLVANPDRVPVKLLLNFTEAVEV
ncbi:glycosyltransferase [Streptomyces coeruleoprunus]|uniref:Glycosyltransferase n=1 Tax=Streptomyces coeruleoprunus TaxID=285563 RepID=A0ABV9XE05_9ACTN